MSSILQTSPLGFPWQTRDPFIFCVHHRDEYPEGNEKMGPKASLAGRAIGHDFEIKDGWRMYHGQEIPGFPYHPHRGFETVTIVKEGIVDHTDSLGAAGRFSTGDVQWMTAGKGVLHSEMFPLLHQDKPNPMELFQLWLNLPRKSKFVQPHFKMLWKESIPEITFKNDNHAKTTIQLIAGKLHNQIAPAPTPDSWAADDNNELMILTIKLETGANYTLRKASQKLHRTLYFYRGKGLKIDETEIKPYHSVLVNSENDIHLTATSEDCYLLVLQGKPINEPVVQHGPFVMNSQKEIYEAFDEYQRTQFGGWPWPEHEQAHPREKERFALHANGSLEERKFIVEG